MATEQGQEKQSRQDLERKIIERAWQDESFLALLRSDPRSAVTQVLGVPFPQDWNIEVHEEKFADIIVRLSALLEAAPEIKELDLNPLLGKADAVVAVDARIRI